MTTLSVPPTFTHMIALLEDRRVLRLAGDDIRPFLNGLLTNDVAKVGPDTPIWAALLSAQGKYLADMILFQGEDGALLLDVHRDRADDLLKKLKLYRLRRPIEIEETDLAVYAAWDEEDEAARPLDPRTPALGRRWTGARADTAATTGDYHARRIALGIPDSPDFEPDRLMWLESGADHLNGVSFTKGCFVGQENTARMNYRGKVRKRLLPVEIDGDPAGETRILDGEREAGTLTSRYAGRGIAHLRLEHAEAPLTLGKASVRADWPDWLPERETP